jgi:hypothetical protein
MLLAQKGMFHTQLTCEVRVDDIMLQYC